MRLINIAPRTNLTPIYILVFGIGYALFSQIHRFCPNFTIYILVDPVLLKLLAAGATFGFYNHLAGKISVIKLKYLMEGVFNK